MSNKKYSVLAVLKVLQKHSDKDNPLLIKQIKILVDEEFGIDISEKTVRSDIHALQSFGYDIRFIGTFEREIRHGDGTVLDSPINKDCYLAGPVTDLQIEILYSALISERFLPDHEYKELVSTLESLSSTVDFTLNSKGAARVKRDYADPDILYGNMQILRKAIAERSAVSFYEVPIGTHGMPGLLRNAKRHVSPCRIFNEGGIYYLLCCDNGNGYGSELAYIRIELMRNIELETWKKFDIYGLLGKGLTTNKDLTNRRFKRIPEENVQISFRFPKTMINEAVDYFGSKSMIFKAGTSDEEHFTAIVSTPEKAMLRFVKINAPDVEIISPVELREKASAIFAEAYRVNQ